MQPVTTPAWLRPMSRQTAQHALSARSTVPSAAASRIAWRRLRHERRGERQHGTVKNAAK
jgi:hypothetical protein